MKTQRDDFVANYQPTGDSNPTWEKRTTPLLTHKHWADCATLEGKPDYLPLRWGRPPDAPQGQSIYWEPQSLDQSKISISRRSSERPESKIIRSFFLWTKIFWVRRLCLNERFFQFHLPAGYKRQCWQPISFWPAGLFLIWLQVRKNKTSTSFIRCNSKGWNEGGKF